MDAIKVAEFLGRETSIIVSCQGCSQCYTGKLIEATKTGIVVGIDRERSNLFLWEQVKNITINHDTVYTAA